MISLFRFLNQSLRRLAAGEVGAFVLFAVFSATLVAVLLYGQQLLGLTPDRIEELMLRGAASPFDLVCVISVFVLVSFTGMPHLFLIAGTLAVFGVPGGVIYAWVGTMCSAMTIYVFGVLFFRPPVRVSGFGPLRVGAAAIRSHGITMSSLVWLAPARLFILGNLLFGAVKMPFFKFLVGTGVASSVKIAVVMALSSRLEAMHAKVSSTDPVDILTVAGFLGLWLVLVLGVRQLLAISPARQLFDAYD